MTEAFHTRRPGPRGGPRGDHALRSSGATHKFYRAGTHRTVAPAETIARLRPYLAEFGITRIANVTGLDRIGVPVIVVCRPNARLTAVFHGKGLDLEAAKASGLMEATETYHAEYVDLPLRLDSAQRLRRRARLVDLDGLPRRSERSFDPRRPILWVEGEDLLRGGPLWLPYEVVHANDALPELPASGCFAAGTNGLASGNHRLEAVNHAICELVERDAQSLWHQRNPRQQAERRIAPETVDDPACKSMLARFEEARLTAGIFDITSDLAIPAFHCILLDPGRSGTHLGYGAGCHPAREIALVRALSEAAQVRMTYIIGSREDLAQDDYTQRNRERRRRRAGSLLAHPTERDFRAVPSRHFDALEDELGWLLERIGAAGLRQVVVVDLTRPEFQIPVARIVIPGLEGSDHHGDYVPGARALAVWEERR